MPQPDEQHDRTGPHTPVPPGESDADPNRTGPGSPGGPAGTAPRPTDPARIGKFQILRVLGAGTFGTVYLALDPDLQRQVAIKVPHGQGLTEAFLKRFWREAQ